MSTVARLSVYWLMCFFPWLPFRLLASVRDFKVILATVINLLILVWGGHFSALRMSK